MSKKDLARRYATKKLHDYPLGSLMLDYGDIRKAYEDGYDKAVELACDYLEEIFGAYCNKNNVIEVFLKTMEEGKA